MSRKQGPRTAGMRPSAIAASRRCDVPENFPVVMRGDDMLSEQGPQACLEMRTPAHVVRVESPQGSHKYSLSYGLLEVGHGH
jgi:hypothetical protein